MNPGGFWEATVREALLMTKGYRQREVAESRRVRLIRYDKYCEFTKPGERVSIYEYMPLPDDPTEEEQQAQATQEQEADRDRITRAYEAYQQQGII